MGQGSLSADASRAAPMAQSEKLSELSQLANESAVFYRDAAGAAGTDTAMGMLFARLARAKQNLATIMANSVPASSKPGASCGSDAAATLRCIRNELRERKGVIGLDYAEKMAAVESGQLKSVLEFLDRDIPMPVRERARPYLRAMHQHQDLIEHTLARCAASAATPSD